MGKIYKNGFLFLLLLFALFIESIEIGLLFVFSDFLATLEGYISLLFRWRCFIINNDRIILFFFIFKLIDALFDICDHNVTTLPHKFLIGKTIPDECDDRLDHSDLVRKRIASNVLNLIFFCLNLIHFSLVLRLLLLKMRLKKISQFHHFSI